MITLLLMTNMLFQCIMQAALKIGGQKLGGSEEDEQQNEQEAVNEAVRGFRWASGAENREMQLRKRAAVIVGSDEESNMGL